MQAGSQEFESPILHPCTLIMENETQTEGIELDEETYQIAVAMAESRGVTVEELLVDVLMEACNKLEAESDL